MYCAILACILPVALSARINKKQFHTKLTNTLASSDAIELCGSADVKLQDFFDRHVEPAEIKEVQGSDNHLKKITTKRQANPESASRIVQKGYNSYGLPTYRLYVCHPGSRVAGWLFSQVGAQSLNTTTLKEVSNLLFQYMIWPMEEGLVNAVRGKMKRMAASVAGKARDKHDTNIPYLWVLDPGGNLIIAPEIQQGAIYKHGDLTPGEKPWSRPVSDGVQYFNPTCCCKPLTAEACKYRTSTVEGKASCCQIMPDRCPLISPYKMAPSFQAFCGELPTEKRTHGPYRGIARAGGEVRFPHGSVPIVQDMSGYSLGDRKIIQEPVHKNGDVDEQLDSFTSQGALSEHAMRKLQKYWMHILGSPWESALYGTVSFNDHGKQSISFLPSAFTYVERTLVRDEGNSVGDFLGMSLEDCETKCNTTPACKSFAFGTYGCHLKDKEVKAAEPASSEIQGVDGSYKTYVRQVRNPAHAFIKSLTD